MVEGNINCTNEKQMTLLKTAKICQIFRIGIEDWQESSKKRYLQMSPEKNSYKKEVG